MNRPKQIGTAAETAVVNTARTRGFPHAERVVLHGTNDQGDVHLTPGLCPGVIIEVKGGDTARSASDKLIDTWLHETETERRHAGAAHAFLVTQRRGVGAPNAHHWWAWWRLGWLPGPPIGNPDTDDTPIRMLYGHALRLLRAAGYGNPLNPPDPHQ